MSDASRLNPSPSPTWAMLVGLLTLPVLAGPVQDAGSRYDQGDPKAALLLLKEHLVQAPRDRDARLLAGRIYLALLQGAAAEKELRMAREAGAGPDQWLAPLVEALWLQGQYDRALDELVVAETGAGEERPLRLALRGETLRRMGQAAQAADAFNAALMLEPEQAQALVGQARLALAQGDLATARALTARANAAHPENGPAWELAADIAFAAGEFDAAEAALIKAELVTPGQWMPRFKRALVRIERGDFAAAAADIERVAEAYPNYPGLFFARGALALRQGRTQEGIAALEQYRKFDPEHLRTLYLLGLGEAILGNLEQAEELLRQFTKSLPDSEEGAVALAEVLLRRNQLTAAEAVLAPLTKPEEGPARVRALRTMARVQRLLGRPAEAVALLERAVAARPQDTDLRRAYAEGLSALGRREQAQAEIEQAAGLAPEDLTTQLLRVKVRLERAQFDEALQLAIDLAAAHPQDPFVLNALGLAWLGKGDIERARQSLKQALAVAPGHADAALNLGRLALREQDFAGARRLFEAVLGTQPDHLEATLALAELDGALGERARQITRLRLAVESAPQQLPLRLVLARALLADAQAAAALELLSAVPTAQADDPDLLLVRGEAELALGRQAEAVTTYEALVRRRPGAAQVWYLLARANALQDRLYAARQALLKAFVLDPGFPLAPTVLELTLGKIPDNTARRELLDELLTASGQDPRLIARKADLLLTSGDPQGAVALLNELAQRHPDDGGVVYKRAEVQRRAGQPDAAMTSLQDWLQQHPEDTVAALLLAETQVQTGDEAAALALLEPLAARHPGDAILLNNVAWLLREQAPERALALAERAHGLAPANPLLLDTLGALLLAGGQWERAVGLLAQANALAPDNATIAWHYAQALATAGRNGEARTLLLGVVERDFPERVEARALLARLPR